MIYILQKDTPTKKAGTKFIYEPRTGGMYYAENDDNIGYHSDIIEHEKEWFLPELNNEFYYCQSEIEDKERCKSQCDHCKNYYAPLEKEASIHESANKFIRKANAMLVEAEKQYFTDRKNAGIQLGKMFIEKAESLLNSTPNAKVSDTTEADSSNDAKFNKLLFSQANAIIKKYFPEAVNDFYLKLRQMMDEAIEVKSNTDQQIKISELREKFFNECCVDLSEHGRLIANGYDTNPEQLFEWFKPYLKTNQP